MAFQILALSGGGYLGLFTAKILEQIEAQIGAPIATRFDLLAGTSIGGIIALGLAKEVPAAKIVEAMVAHGAEIFSNRPPPKALGKKIMDALSSVRSPKYGTDGLKKILDEILGDSVLGEARHRVIVPAVNMTRGSIQMFKTPHHENFRLDHTKLMVDIALATSAAPVYFPLAEIGDALYADGGVFANAPDLCAIHEARHFLGAAQDDISILSIGTTTSSFSFSHSIGKNLGSYDWVASGRLWATISSAQQQLVEYMMRHQLGDRYVRIDHVQSREQQEDLGLDIATAAATATIKGVADGAYQVATGNPKFQQMLKHVPNAVTFFHGPWANVSGTS
jgi:predicted acylesterase/phospholipase RssA